MLKKYLYMRIPKLRDNPNSYILYKNKYFHKSEPWEYFQTHYSMWFSGLLIKLFVQLLLLQSSLVITSIHSALVPQQDDRNQG